MNSNLNTCCLQYPRRPYPQLGFLPQILRKLGFYARECGLCRKIVYNCCKRPVRRTEV